MDKIGFVALELCIRKLEDYKSTAEHISEHGVYKLDSYCFPTLKIDESSKQEAKDVLIRMCEKQTKLELDADEQHEQQHEQQRERWDRPFPEQYGLCNGVTDTWPKISHHGYQFIQVLLIHHDLLTKEQMRDIKNSPGAHLPTDLIKTLTRKGITGDPATIRKYIVKAAETFIG